MDPNTDPTPTKDKQVTVDVPEDRIAEFHAFFGRFLAGATGRGRRGRPGRRHGGVHGHRCGHRHEATDRVETPGATEV